VFNASIQRAAVSNSLHAVRPSERYILSHGSAIVLVTVSTHAMLEPGYRSASCFSPCLVLHLGVALTRLLWSQVLTARLERHHQLCVAYQDYHQLGIGAVSGTAGVGSGRADRTCLRRTRGLPHSCLPPGTRTSGLGCPPCFPRPPPSAVLK
jgi:hypothetical protein